MSSHGCPLTVSAWGGGEGKGGEGKRTQCQRWAVSVSTRKPCVCVCLRVWVRGHKHRAQSSAAWDSHFRLIKPDIQLLFCPLHSDFFTSLRNNLCKMMWSHFVRCHPEIFHDLTQTNYMCELKWLNQSAPKLALTLPCQLPRTKLVESVCEQVTVHRTDNEILYCFALFQWNCGSIQIFAVLISTQNSHHYWLSSSHALYCTWWSK